MRTLLPVLIAYLLLIGIIGVISWASREHIRVRLRSWIVLVSISLLGGPLEWLTMWVTRDFTHTSNHPMYLVLGIVLLLPCLVAVALLKKWYLMCFMALVFFGILFLNLGMAFGGACAVFGECL